MGATAENGPMRVLVAFDKFKDSMTAGRACEVAARAIRSVHPDWELDLCPLTDGGDGFAEVLTSAAGGRTTAFQVEGPRGGLVEAPVGMVPAAKVPPAARAMLGIEGTDLGNTGVPPVPDTRRRQDAFAPGHARARPGPVAIVEMASASGLALLPPELRDPWHATSHGTGQLIRAAAELGAAAVLLGVGGSATHDLGLGALGALGYEFRSRDGAKLRPATPARWPDLAAVEGERFHSIPPLFIACDVSHPLLGPSGAAASFGPQKGLKPGDLGRLETESARVAALLCDHCAADRSLANAPGAGAAGGIALGLMVAAGAKLLPGASVVFAWLDLEARTAAADLVLTGEGCYDASSASGKGPGALVARALALGKFVHVFAGRIDAPPGAPGPALHPITPAGTPLPVALRRAPSNLADAIGKAFQG